MTAWCLTTSPQNFAKTAELGWTVQGIKRRRRRTAEQLAPGDRLVYYLTGAGAFAATVEVTSRYFEDHAPVWSSKPGEDYPWRFAIRPEIVVAHPERWVPAVDLLARLEFPRRWPPEHWRLAFQGNIRAWPEQDYLIVRQALEDAAAGTG
jgi:hypothetical protein